MSSLFHNVLSRSKDSLLKESLQNQLVACVKDIQLDHAHSGKFQNSNEAAEAFCTVLEAIFLHGIKESLVDKMVLAMGDPDTRPEPNFWPFLLVFSHRELIDQITGLNFISTDVGRCRAWLRLALNEALLTSYMQSMLSQRSSLSSFYKRAAYLRDKELLDMSVTLVSGVEAYPFNLASNSSLLNMWTNQPLLMAGIWSPAMKNCPISSGTDIAQSLTNEDLRIAEDSVSSVVSGSFYESSLGSNPFDENEALKIILGCKTTQGQDGFIKNDIESGYDISHSEENAQRMDKWVEETKVSSGNENPMEESKVEDTKEIEQSKSSKCESEHSKDKVRHEECIKPTENKDEKKQILQSYNSLVESYNKLSTTSSKVPDLQDLLQKFQSPNDTSPSTSEQPSHPTSDPLLEEPNEKLDFEVVSDNIEQTEMPDFKILIQYITRISIEMGLDSQNYKCTTCSHYIGINFGPAKVCGLSGKYFCSDCFSDHLTEENCIIPARVIYNWDFRPYTVSQKAAKFLKQIEIYPLFDLSLINPKIYGAVPEMARLKELRVRLRFLSAYLLTCRENPIQTLQKQIWPREYLYEKDHLYSLWDLIQVSTGQLESLLQGCIESSRTHVMSCSHCSLRGYICEICNNPKIIFPFDLDTTYRCKNCNAVYHSECLRAGQLCPKCLRIQQRLTSQNDLNPPVDPL
ncbi:pleckstrin homology domain-containing family M member 1 [Macrosteles quadrilineatus]|uniref:pleckstrin homology domain-containing family M member 1 n=1 Tax=Macrosteles quadrilineatus TaxID=74068 RepID=UPI0023E1A2BE|nr:pleckstrin homology domain-containing family M member 1 [Macrosteles quadrilineatus]